MPTIQAERLGSLAVQAIKTSTDVTVVGEVLASFPNSFYIRTQDDQLLFFTNRALPSPITVIIGASDNFANVIKPHEELLCQNSRLFTRNLSIDLKQVSRQPISEDSTRRSPDFVRLVEASEILSVILSIIDTKGSALDATLRPIHNSITDFVRNIIDLRDGEEFVAAALKIVGLGMGFTPSGDDLLLGFLLVYNSLAQTIARAPIHLEFKHLVKRTNWISAKLLDYAQHLLIDDQMQAVVDSISNIDQDPVLAVETLIPRGHTSGIDIAAGIVLGISVICDAALEHERTEYIATMLGLPLEPGDSKTPLRI